MLELSRKGRCISDWTPPPCTYRQTHSLRTPTKEQQKRYFITLYTNNDIGLSANFHFINTFTTHTTATSLTSLTTNNTSLPSRLFLVFGSRQNETKVVFSEIIIKTTKICIVWFMTIQTINLTCFFYFLSFKYSAN